MNTRKIKVYLINQDMNIVYAINGFKTDDIKGKDTNNMATKKKRMLHLISILEGKQHAFEEVNGKMLLKWFGFPISNERGLIQFGVVVMVVINLSDNKVVKKLHAINDKLSELANFVAHDFRSPISTVLGLIYLWDMEGKVEGIRTFSDVEVIKEVGRRITLLDIRVKNFANMIDEIDARVDF